MGQNHVVIVLPDLWNKNPWTLCYNPSVLIAIKETENLWLEIKRYQTFVINDCLNLSVAERDFHWFHQCASLCVYTHATDVHTQSVTVYRLHICACPYIIPMWLECHKGDTTSQWGFWLLGLEASSVPAHGLAILGWFTPCHFTVPDSDPSTHSCCPRLDLNCSHSQADAWCSGLQFSLDVPQACLAPFWLG